MIGDMSCSTCPKLCQWLCAIIIILLTNIALGAVPSFVSPLEDGSTTISLPESTAIGTPVYTIEARDTDDLTGASITYDLDSQVPEDRFVLTGTTVETTAAFDYETGLTEWTLTFSATTSNGTVSANLNVSISDVNDEMPQISGSFTTEIPEEQPAGTVIPTTFTATDADANDVLRYSISGDTSYFDIDSTTGIISVSQQIDFETATQTTFHLIVTVRDAAGHTTSQPITVNLLNINDNQPVFINALVGGSGNKNIPETTPAGTSIYKVEDEDADGDAVSIDLVTQTPPDMFTFDGTTVRTATEFDFETGLTSFTLTFEATSNGDTSTATLTVNIEDVNDEVPQISGQFTVDIDEALPIGTVVPIILTVVDGDAADIDALVYSISGEDAYFEINAATGVITSTEVLDYDSPSSKKTFSLTLTVRDTADNTANQPVTVNLRNINDNEPVFLNAISTGSDTKQIPETIAVDTSVYKIEAGDADGDSVSVALVEQTPAGGFTFDGTILRTAQMFDYEAGPNSYTLTFNATSAGDVATAILTLEIQDINDEIPQITGQFTITIDEKRPTDWVVPFAFTVVDNDAADANALTYSISGDDDLYFNIGEKSGAITTNQVLDYETVPKTTFLLTMSVRDTAGHVKTQLLTIHLRNLNDNEPVFVNPRPDGSTTKEIPETTPPGETIYTIEAYDADGATVVHEILAQDPPGMFDLSGSSIVTTGTFDYESGPTSFILTLNAASEGNITTTTLTIIIEDENDETPTITGPLSVDIEEDVAKGTVIPVLYTVADADEGEVLRYNIAGDNKFFEIDSSSGELKASQLLDYDTLTQTTFYTTLTVTDAADHSATATITINLLPINDNLPVFIKPHPSGVDTVVVPESKGAGSDIYTVQAKDGDGDQVTYELDDPSNMFTLIGTVLRTKSALDFESQPSMYTLTFRAIAAGDTATATLTVSIQDENDNWPIIQGTFNSEIDEELPEGSLVPSSFTVTDEDAGDVLRYTLSGNGARYFSINHDNGVIRTAQVLDYESVTTTTFFLTVTVTDLAGHETEEDIAISLRNINDNPLTFIKPPSSGGTAISVSETVSIATNIYTLEAVDNDGGNIVYQLVSQVPPDVTMFELNGDTVSTSGEFDFETGPRTYTLTFNASTDIEWTTSVLTVLISDDNDETPVITGTFTADLNEERPVGSTVPLAISAADADAGDELRFSLSGADSNLFDIDTKSGTITTKEKLNYDTATKTEFVLTVTVTDRAGQSATQTVTINLLGINDNSPVFSPITYYKTIQENTAEGTVVVELLVSDADGDAVTLSIASGDLISDRKFQLVDKSIQTTSSAIDYESLTSQGYKYTLTVTATDGIYTGTATVYVTITGENEHGPQWETFNLSPSLAEDAVIGTTVVTILASDQDEGPDGVIKYTIDSISPSPSGRPVDGLFHLDEDTGVLTTKSSSFDRDISTGGVERYNIVVRATDREGQGQSITATLDVTLTDVNDNRPVFSKILSLVEIKEVNAAGTLIQELEATDADASSTLTYHIDGTSSPSSYNTYFAIEELNKLKLRTTIDLDVADSVDTFQLVVVVKDGGNPELSGTTTVLVIVAAVNENTPVFTGAPYGLDLSEGTSVDTDILTVKANDGDSGTDGEVSYSIEAGDPDHQFTIDPSTGVIKLAKPLDYETKAQHLLTVKAADGGTPAEEASTTVTINVLDENDNLPTCDELSIVVTIPETRVQGDLVTQVSCEDADTDTVSYRIKSGDNTVFDIDSDSGLITLLRAVDYDSGETFFRLVISVDSGADTLEVSVAVTVSPVNEHTPVFNVPDTVVLREDVAVGTTISSLIATDRDAVPHAIVKYQLASVSNGGDGLFRISQSTGVLRLTSSLDYEAIQATDKQYVIQVHAIDGGSPVALTGTGTLTVSIQDINDNYPQCDETSYILTLPEDTAVDHVLIADFGCFDDDAGTVLQYSLDPNSQNYFRLDDLPTKQLVLGASLNFDVINSYSVILTVSDGLHDTEIDIDISITDVNNGPPTFPLTQYTANILETANIGTSVITIIATDPDADSSPFGKLIYTLTANPGLKFNIDPNGGQVTLAGKVDADVLDEYILVIQAAEEGGDFTATATLTVNIDDVNDNEPTCSQYSFSVSLSELETTPVPKVIYTLNCNDRDSSSVLQYSIASGDSALFQMNQNDLRLIASIDYETIVTDSYEVVIAVTDGDFTVQVSGVVTITGDNEFSPVFSQATYQVTKAEDTALSSVIATVLATDGDRGDIVTYSLLSSFDEFKIEPSSGNIILVGSLDRETRDSFELVVRATDGNSSVTATVEIAVSDVNDHTPTFNPTSYSETIPENTPADQSIKLVTAVDHDDPNGPGLYGLIQYSLVDTFNAFKIDPNTGEISTTVEINYEEATFYTLTVIATDSNYGVGAQSSSAIVTVMVTGINEHAPVWATFQPAGTEFSMPEDAAIGHEIVTLSATDDDDGIHGVVFYSIDKITTNPAGRTTTGLFHLDQVSGKLTTTSNAFDRDVKIGGSEYYDIVAKATDQEFTATTTIRVSLTDVNDNSPVFTEAVYNEEILETDAADTAIIALTATDADDTAVVTYSLDTSSSPPSYNTYFTLDGNTIKLLATVDLDPPVSAASTFHLVVLAEDGGTPELTGTTTVIVSVKASNEDTPTFTAGPYTVNDIPETIGVGDEVITLVATDNDYGSDGVVEYTKAGGDPDSHFSIHPTSGKVKVAKSLDYERKSQYVLTIEARDRGSPRKSSSTTLTINLLDESDSVPTCQNTLIDVTLLETYQAGDQVVALSCEDEDIIDTIEYIIKSGDTTVFQIDSVTGVVTLKRGLDYDEQGDDYFELVIGVQGGDDSIDVTVSVTVSAVNEFTPNFTDNNVVVSVSESAATGSTVATMEATDGDAEPHGIVRYSISSVTNGGSSLFAISKDTGIVRLIGSLDYESLLDPKEYVVKVLAVDGGAKTGTGTLTVSVVDENDNVPACAQNSYTESILETTVINTEVIPNFGCSDADAGTVLTYTLSQKPSNHFRIETTPTARLLVDAALNFDTNNHYTLTLSVSDGLHTTDVNIDILITDVNNGGPLFDKTVYTGSVSETASAGTSIVTVSASDPDASSSKYGQLVYTLIENSENKFNVDPNTGRITLAGNLDAEDNARYILVVRVSEKGGVNTATATVNVTVEDENDNEPECSKYSFSISMPETSSGDLITLNCDDKDLTDTVDYSIAEGDTSLFRMNQNILQLIAPIDYDTSPTDRFIVDIDVSDGAYVVQVSGIVTITAVNENTPVFTEATYQVSKTEDIAQGATVIKVTATDSDKGDTIEYSLASPNKDDFSVDETTGEIILLTRLDRETQANHELIIHASDGLHTATATVALTLIDVNDHTPTFQATSYSATVPENEANGYTVISVQATDLDDPNYNKYGEVRYYITNTNDAFVIDATSGEITTKKSLDYEDTPTYTIFVQAIDSGGGPLARSSSVAVTIKVENINEDTPTFTQDTYSLSVPENHPVGTLLMQVVADDSDTGIAGDVVYSMLTHNYFYLASKTGEISLKSPLDYESSDKSFVFEVVATDSAPSPKSSTSTVSVTVLDINDNRPICEPNLQTTIMPEDSSAGTNIAQLTCTDSDSNENADLTYVISLVNNVPPGGTFTIDNQGRLTLATSTLDYESITSYSILVKVTDSGNPPLSSTATIKLEITNINEHAPVFVVALYQVNIRENFVSSDAIVRVEASDQDTADRISYYFDPENTNFDIDRDNGDIFVISALDYETLGTSKSVELTAYAVDNGAPDPRSSSTTVTVVVQNENDGTPIFAQGVYYGNVLETSPVETTILNVFATDSDGEPLTYSFGATSDTFRIEQTGDIVLHDDTNLDYDTGPTTYRLIVHAEDPRSGTGTATVYIVVLNENEHDPIFSDFDRSVNVKEDAQIDHDIITISAADDDNGVDGRLTYHIISGDDGKFAIDKHTGQITVSGSLDREAQTSYSLIISSLDGGTPQRSVEDTLNINIIDVNDVKPSCEKQLYSLDVAENTASGTTILTLVCNDGDDDPNGINNRIGSFMITDGNTADKFEVTQEGEVQLKDTVDREILDAYTLTVLVADAGVPSLTTTVTVAIQITDVNDNDPSFDQDNYLFSVSELSSVGYIVGTVHATDLDIGGAGFITYQILTGNEAGKFAVDELSGVITLVDQVDFDRGDQAFNLDVAAVNGDGSGRSSVCLVAIIIQDENDNRPNCPQLLYTATVAENTVATTEVLSLDCDDTDTVGDALQYTIQSGNGAGYFGIGLGSGSIFIAKALDAETVQTVELIVDVTDDINITDGALITSIAVKVIITDINEYPPSISPVNAQSVLEDVAVGTILYTLSVSDDDISDADFTYTITGGDPDQLFSIGTTSGDIQLHKALDRELVDAYIVTIQVADGLGADAMTSEIDITFNVEDINDNYPLCEQTTYTLSLPENSAGQVILSPVCTDADTIASPLLKYEIVSGNDDGIFSINEDTGQIDLIGNLNYETKTIHELKCAIDDQGNPSKLISTIAVIVHVEPINEYSPQFIDTNMFDVAIDETTPAGTSITRLRASDNDTGLHHGDIRFSISNGNINNVFAINSRSGVITLVKSLNYEVITDYSLTVTAKDSLGSLGALSADFVVHINVNDVNDISPECSPSLIAETHDENLSVGSVVAQLQCIDIDASPAFNTLSYNVISINGDTSATATGQFAVSTSGIVTLQSNLNYEDTKYASILIEVSDGGLLTTATVELTINDVNEHDPAFEMPAYSANLKETTIIGTLILNVKANDADVNDRISFYFEPQDDRFEIDSRTGDIYLTSTIDFDVMGVDKTIQLTAVARDNGDNPGPRSTSVDVTITVVNENDGSPVFTPGVYSVVIPENLNNEDTVTTVTASDIDDANLAYLIISGNDDNVFRIDKTDSNGVLIINDNALLDYERMKSYTIVVRAVDAGGLTGTTTVAIEVTGYNEFSPHLNSLSSTQFVPENSAIGHHVIDLDATDDDQGPDGEITYTITSGNTGKFSIDPTSGLVTVAGSLDREDIASYTLEITVADKGVQPGPLSVVYTLTVSLVDVNDISPVCTSSYYSVSIKEDVSVGTVIAQLDCTDGDVETPNNVITTYVITRGNEGGEFLISTNGAVSTAETLDYEAKHYYELVIHVSDSGTPALTTTTTLGITVSDDNDNPPVFTENPYQFEAPEDTPVGTSVGQISASDADTRSAGEMVYSFVSGNDDGVFALDRTTGILYVAKALDYDTNPNTYTLVVRATDRSASPLFDTSTIQFIIHDVNDQPPVCTSYLYSGTVPEDAAFQTRVITVSCADTDMVGTVTYSIVDGNVGSAFIINENTGLITVATEGVLDSENLDTYDLLVQAADGIFLVNVTVVILITDVNDVAPVFVPPGPYQFDMSEHASIGHTIVDLDVSDSDNTRSELRFAIASGNEDGKFKIGTMNGILQLQREVDREALISPVYNLEVTVTDGLFTATTTVNINVEDENDNYIVCDQVSYTTVVPETTLVGSTVFEPDCTDPDSTTDMHFEIVSGNEDNKFLVDEDDGKLKLQSQLDYETTTSYTITVTVSDQGTPSLTTTLLMSVFVGAENEHKPELYGSFNVSLYEDAPINHIVVSLFANDSDIGLNHAAITYAIKNGNGNNLFNIHPSTGKVTLVGRLDYETATTHILTITATDMSPRDAGRKSAEEIFTIHVLDVNDNYPVFDPQVYSIELKENAEIGTTVASLTATDADSGLAGTIGLQFNIIRGNTGNAFSLSGSDIILDKDVDTDIISNYILTVTASDQGNPVLSSNTIVSIYIKPVNEHEPIFSVPNDTITVEESIAVGEQIYQLTATDDDTGIYSELRYYIRSGNVGGAFTVDSNTGAITLANMLDYDIHPEPYVLQLEVEDTHRSQPGTTRTGTMTLTVIVNDINDEIPIFSQTTYTPSIRENIPEGTRILTVTATDGDTGPNGEITYHIAAGTGISIFEIDPVSGAISTRIGSTIDYETRSSYDVIVVAQDSGIPAQSASALVHITILDLNDETPTFEVTSFVTTILEEQPIDTFLTTVKAVDKDSIRDNNNVFTYSFSETSAEFRIDQSSGDIYTTAILDREAVSSYTLVVYATDQGPDPNTGSTTVNIQVIDINDNDPEISGVYDTEVSEDAITNTAVFMIEASDIDSGDNGLLNYSITDGNINGDFKIDPGTGYIQVYNSLNRERTAVYHLEITVTDSGTPARNAIRSATVTILDINDNHPIFDQTTYHFNVSEDVPVETPVGRVTATDADTDVNAALRYMIGSFIEGDSNHFKVDGASGVLRTSGLLDRENADLYVFIYRAIDGGSPALTATTTVSIRIGDFDDQIPEFENFFYSAHTLENQPIGTSILTVVTSDKDFGPNAEITLTIDTKTTQGVRANEFIAIDSSTSTLSVKREIDRETDTSFHFILIATDGGASPLTATATVSIIVDDVNDERPAFSPTYYNAEIAYNDDCAVTVTTLSASDKDYGVNAEFKYRFTLNPAPQLFQLKEDTGDITLLATAAPYTKYILYAEATDSGSPPLTSNGVTIRIDTFTPNDHIIIFNLGITEEVFHINEVTFLNQLTTVFRVTHPTARVKRWCISGDISDSKAIFGNIEPKENYFHFATSNSIVDTKTIIIPMGPNVSGERLQDHWSSGLTFYHFSVTQVHLYVVKNNLTDTEASIENTDKEFLSSVDAFAIVSADDEGTPANDIKGSAWEVFEIVSVEKYYVEEPEETPFFQTAAGIAIIVLIVLLLVAAIAVGIIFLLRKAKKDNWFSCLNQVEHGEDDGGDHVARNQYLTKTYEKKPLPPIGYYDKSNLPPPVVALPMPSSTKKVPLQVQSQIYERPKDMHIYSDLIGFRPGSGVGSRLMKHPEKLRSGSPASSSELPPIRKLPSLVSRPPSFAPQIRDVSLREETPRPYDDSMRTIDDETVSLGTTKEYDGRAVDPVTGRVYEYSTRTHERRWVSESENGSHFKLKTDEK